jgi:hypothetical protein
MSFDDDDDLDFLFFLWAFDSETGSRRFSWAGFFVSLIIVLVIIGVFYLID